MPNNMSQSPKERAAISRLRQILNEHGIIRGGLVRMKNTCGKPSCRCAGNKRHRHISWYISQSKNGRQRMKCIPKETLKEVSAWLNRYKEIHLLFEQVSDEYWRRLGWKRKRA